MSHIWLVQELVRSVRSVGVRSVRLVGFHSKIVAAVSVQGSKWRDVKSKVMHDERTPGVGWGR